MGFDKSLTLLAVATLIALGVVSLYGIYDYAMESRADSSFMYSMAYLNFMQKMDRLAFPFAVAFILILAICIPKRIVPERYLIPLSALLLVLAFGLYLKDYRLALGVVLAFALILQAGVLALTMAGKELHFLSIGYKKRTGSALTHLGIVMVTLSIVQPDWVILDSLTVFWGATITIGAGMLLLFYTKSGGNE
ncbi:hypothetical protein [Candidatus Pyrohabitans sp.]